MSGTIPDDRVAELPAELPIFPLTGVLLLPQAQLPLHIFEPRYLNMVEHALGGSRMIGMVQPRRSDRERLPDDAEVYPTGCAGRIVSFAETEDGRYLITLRGVCRFQIAAELPLFAGYRRVAADFSTFRQDLDRTAELRIDRDRLLDAARSYLLAKDATTDWSAIENAPDRTLVNALAMMCPFEPREKQALLECAGFVEQADMLIALLEIDARDHRTADERVRH